MHSCVTILHIIEHTHIACAALVRYLCRPALMGGVDVIVNCGGVVVEGTGSTKVLDVIWAYTMLIGLLLTA